RGGLAGGAAMAVLALLYGLIGHKSIWYPINLLAAAGSADLSSMSYQQLLSFIGTGLVLAIIIHLAASILVGLLYSVCFPFSRDGRCWWVGLSPHCCGLACSTR